MNLNFNFFNIIIFAGIVQGFLFSIVVLTSKAFKDRANKYLALTIISLSLNNLYYWLIDIGLETQYEEVNLFYLPWHLLFPITFYMYVYEYVSDKIKKHILWFLITPFLASSVTHILINIFRNPTENYPFWVEIFYISEEYLAFIIALSVGFLAYKKLKIAKNRNPKINIKWLNILLRSGLILCLIWVVIYSLATKFSLGGLKLYYPIWLGISIMFYWIGYRGLYQFKLAKDRKAISELLKEISSNENPQRLNNRNAEEYTEEHPIFRKFKDLVEKEHIYRNQDITLDSLAKKLKTNRSTLSGLINQVSGQKFTDYINEYRVEEAKTLLTNPDFDKYKISAIGYEVGFNHVSTFYSVFKKYTGVTPTKFKETKNISQKPHL
ncbi:AraC family transcriptional regulator [Aquimarina sp. I32.4]|uniref:helix-turn-helix domain-containing protein n=1 Tax=Aquimarina sp. I32.4 TaxID=2053903 RepID=UPI000CDED431|nr:response regulator transcription factor [Aquimarina sp. I32.4]